MTNIPENFGISLQQCILDEAKKQNKTPGKLFADFYNERWQEDKEKDFPLTIEDIDDIGGW